MLLVADGRHEEVFTFFPDRVITNRSGMSAPIDLTPDFVKLRIVVRGSDFTLTLGDKTLLDGRGRFSAPAHQGRRVIQFGSRSSAARGEALWKSVRYRIEQR